MDPDAYCREIERYLCRKNDGHLVRVVGPGFNLVIGWAARGVPFKVACRGIDRYFERYYAKGPRRRPVRIEFCEADVLDVFDEWRRAVGIGMAGGEEAAAPKPRSDSLRAHLDRVVTRLTDVQARDDLASALAVVIARLIERLAIERDGARAARGEARQLCIGRLQQLDRELTEAVRELTPRERLAALRDEAAEELAGYRDRMAPETYDRAVEAAFTKLLREHYRLPTIGYGQG